MVLPASHKIPQWLVNCLAQAGNSESVGNDIPGMAASREAAVLVLFVLHAEPTILLTRRAAHLSAHPGQICFPGGSRDITDADLVATALRETQEEVGLDPARVTVHGVSTPYVTSSRFLVTPVVATVEPGFSLRAAPDEVDAIFELPASLLLDPTRYERRWVERHNLRNRSHFMDYGDYLVWGATAGILIMLGQHLGWPGFPVDQPNKVYYPEMAL